MTLELHRILVPVIGDQVDEEAIHLACSMVHQSKGTVYVLYVIRVSRDLPLDAEITTASSRGEDVLQRMEELGQKYKCKIDAEILQAREIGPAIVDEAIAREVNMIIIGMTYEKQYGIFRLRGTVPYVLQHAPCRVVVWREEILSEEDLNGS